MENLGENLGDSSVRRSGGSPLGSKNKPKDNPSTTNKVVLVVPPGINIIQWVEGFAQDNGVSLAILTGSGAISEVALKHKGSQLQSQEFKEQLNLVSFSGAYILSPSGGGSSSTKFFNTSLVRDDYSVVSGSALHMVALGPVLLKYPNSVADKKQKVLRFKRGLDGEGNLLVATFNKVRCRSALAKFVVKDEQAFNVTEGEGFKDLINEL
ncbi:hypothetical protein POM88_028104 [Heracleum sosnowskyi]|uniref:PPC domain-containing protein n=1 Tax=Heracleum sosnowskyi TaxID=360622 RepID=A0AAD8MM14_9APIA|nr:hypothetical protein POM88_028104 [Heracleum sosnowskyi]